MTTVPIYNMTDTWNNGATVFTAIKMNVTNTASAAGSLLMDLQVGGTSLFNFGVNGQFNIASGTLTASAPALNITQTWNNAGTVFTGIISNITKTAANTVSLLIDLQVGGASMFSVRQDGLVRFNSSTGSLIGAFTAFDSSYAGVEVVSGGTYAFSSSSSNPIAAADVFLNRDAAGALALRNSTTAQVLRVYNTYSSAGANYERGVFDWNSSANVLTIGTENAGTGIARNMQFVIGGASKLDWNITNPSAWTFTNDLHTSAGLTVASAGFFIFGAHGSIDASNGNGQFQFAPNGGGSFFLTAGVGLNSVIQCGLADAASPTAQTLQVQSVVAGTTNTAGANWTLKGSLSTGSGASGDIIFQTGDTGALSTTQNAENTALTLKSGTASGKSGSVVIGSAALATNATDGFIYIPTCAGTPTGTPTTFTGRVPMIYDTTNNKFYIYNSGWKGGTNPGAFT